MEGKSVEANLPRNSWKKPHGWGARHTLSILGFWAFAVNYALRFNLSLAIVGMVKPSSNFKSENNPDICPQLFTNDTESVFKEEDQGEFEWSEAEQGLILSIFFWGHTTTQFPGGMIATKYGGKWPMGFGLLITGIFGILTPIAARTDKYLLMLCRIIQGFGEGITAPTMHAIIAKWAPPNERSIIGSVVYAGSLMGTAITMVAGGYLMDAGVMGGWPSLFYLPGFVTIIWFLVWWAFMHESPAVHPSISVAERNYIETSIACDPSVKIPVPWRTIWTSMPFWAILVGNVCNFWGFYAVLTSLPTYLKNVLHYDMNQNGWLSAFPFLLMGLVSLTTSQIMDLFRSRKRISTTWVRKICNTIAQVGPAIALVGAAYSGCERNLTVALLTLSMALNGCLFSGCFVNHVDIAPNHAGILMGITNTVGNVMGIIAPYVSGVILNDNPRVEDWRLVFVISAAIFMAGGIFYLVYASGDQQPWNDSENHTVGFVATNPVNSSKTYESSATDSDLTSFYNFQSKLS